MNEHKNNTHMIFTHHPNVPLVDVLEVAPQLTAS